MLGVVSSATSAVVGSFNLTGFHVGSLEDGVRPQHALVKLNLPDEMSICLQYNYTCIAACRAVAFVFFLVVSAISAVKFITAYTCTRLALNLLSTNKISYQPQVSFYGVII